MSFRQEREREGGDHKTHRYRRCRSPYYLMLVCGSKSFDNAASKTAIDRRAAFTSFGAILFADVSRVYRVIAEPQSAIPRSTDNKV